MLTMKLSKYYEVKKPEYCYLKLTPNKSTRNYNAEQIVLACTNLYKTIAQRMYKENIENQKICKRWQIEQSKILYYIYLAKDSIEFYFVIPKDSKHILIDKIQNCWQNATITEIGQSDISQFSTNAVAYGLKYKYTDMMSVNTNMTNNCLLSSICNTVDIMEQGDKCGVLININPVSKNALKSWQTTYEDLLEQYNKGYPVNKQHGIQYMLLLAIKYLAVVIDFALDLATEVFGGTADKKKDSIVKKEISANTQKKKYALITKTQILVLSEATDKMRSIENAEAICQSFNMLDEDNEFEYKQLNNVPQIMDYNYKSADSMIMSTKETGKLIELAGKELIEKYPIQCVGTIQTEIPEELQNGTHYLGVHTYKDKKTKTYLSQDYNISVMSILLSGVQGVGKSVFLANFIHNCQQQGEGCVVIDYIKNCELSKSIIAKTPKDKLVLLDFTKDECLQSFTYNEFRPKDNSVSEMLAYIDLQTIYMEVLLNALNVDGEPLTPLMSMYLDSACKVVFSRQKTSLKNVIDCLFDYNYRHKCINEIPKELRTEFTEEIATLTTLDNYDKKTGVYETKTSKIEGILSRVFLLKKNSTLKKMFSKNDNNNIDFVDALEQGKTIIVQMPQAKFPTYIKDVLSCYIFTKLWCATMAKGAMHDRPKITNLCIDEVFQCPTLTEMLSRPQDEILPQLRKFGLRCIFSCQRFAQMGKIKDTLKSSGANYMYLKGSIKQDFEYNKEELYPYTYDDLLNIDKYQSLNLINTFQGRVPFITKLPPPL